MPYKFEIPKTDEDPLDAPFPVIVIDAEGEKTTRGFKGYRLWEAMQDARADFWKVCGGDGVCGTCRVEILEGAENLSPKTWLEREGAEHRPFFFVPAPVVGAVVWVFWRVLHFGSRIGPNRRLACQAYLTGPVKVAWRQNQVQSLWARIKKLGRGASPATQRSFPV